MSTTRPRAPLASIPNATNSPNRPLTQSIGKRSRQHGTLLLEDEPPAKRKQAVDVAVRRDCPSTPRRRAPPSVAEGQVFERGPSVAAPNDFHRRLIASRKNAEWPAPTDGENVLRSWHKYYRKAFHTFVFYFDGVPHDSQVKCSKHLRNLGAREERFFSRAVTHIVTTRPIPPKASAPDATSKKADSNTDSNVEEPPGTVNPCLLLKKPTATGHALPPKDQPSILWRRSGAMPTDILFRGRQMGMNIWAVEKLHRVLASMLEYDATHGQNGRANVVNAGTVRTRDQDLSQTLRNEKVNGSLERDWATSMRETTLFRGPFIYVYDVEGKTRPVLVRQYPKVARDQDGIWPQFRSACVGKCPFVEDLSFKREIEKQQERERAAQKAQQQRQAIQTGSVTVCDDATRSNIRRSPRKALGEVQNAAIPAPDFQNVAAKVRALEAPKACPQTSLATRQESAGGFVIPQGRHIGREPAASGIQQSNLTSAIRSQMISSTAAAPGAKAGTSKEVNELKRKVLERTHTGSLSVGSIPSSHRMTDIAGALKNARAAAPQRVAKSKAQERLGGVPEAVDNSEDELAGPRAPPSAPLKKKAAARYDPRPGYCENCREKYNDFDDHIVDKKHRKFALTQSNWTELDRLLRKLQQYAQHQEQQQRI